MKQPHCENDPLDHFVPFVYSELRRLAAGYMRAEKEALTLQATALVHEAWLRLAKQDNLAWRDRGHFLGIAARCMRQILVDHARSRMAQKRGGGMSFTPLDEAHSSVPDPSLRMIELDEAIKALSALEPRKGRAIELHYFAGLGAEEMAAAMDVSVRTARRDLRIAEAWLHRELMHNG